MNHYKIFGLVFRSDIALPSLEPAATPPCDPDVDVVLGAPARPDPGVEFIDMQVEAVGDRVRLWVPECAWFEIIDGRTIVYQPEPGATAEQVALYLLGTAFGVVLYQRGMLPMHCNAIVHDGRAFLFCGDSGAGKSTLAAFLERRGYPLLTDDVCAVRFDADGRPIAYPGIPRLKLWTGSLEALGRSADGLSLIPWYDDKYEMPMMRAMPTDPVPIAAIYHLRTATNGAKPEIVRLGGLDAANAITANIYRRRIADLLGAGPEYLSAAVRIIAATPIFAMNRDWGLDRFEAGGLHAEEHFRALD